MKSIAAMLFSFALTGALAAPPVFSCPSGGNWVPWQLRAEWFAETPLFAGDQNKNVATVCNCTEDSATADAGIYIVTIQPIPPGQKSEGRILSHRPGAYKQRVMKDNDPPPDDMKPGPGNDIYYMQGGACAI